MFNVKSLIPKEKKALTENEQKTFAEKIFVPNTDIFENENEIVLTAEMPGVKKDNLTVELQEGVLSLEGKVDVSEYQDMTPLYGEYNIGSYSRRFNLGTEIDRSKIEAKMDKGVLTLTLPKHAETRPVSIEIK